MAGARWIIFWMIGALVASIAAWALGQYAAAAVLERTVLGLERSGLRVTAAGRQRGGWPFSATIMLRDVHIDTATNGAADHNLPLHWSAAKLIVQASPLHPLTIAVIAGGTQRVRFDGQPTVTVWGDRLAAYLPWQQSIAGRLRIPVEARAMHVALGQAGPDWVLTVSTLSGALFFSPGGNLAVSLDGGGLVLPQAGPHPLGRVMTHLSVAMALPPGLGTPGWPADAPLLIQQASLAWSGLDLDLTGQLRLDPPSGRFLVGLSGLHDALRNAVSDGDLPTGQAAALNGLIGLIGQAKAQYGGQQDQLRDLPLSLHDGSWWLGAVPLMRLP